MSYLISYVRMSSVGHASHGNVVAQFAPANEAEVRAMEAKIAMDLAKGLRSRDSISLVAVSKLP